MNGNSMSHSFEDFHSHGEGHTQPARPQLPEAHNAGPRTPVSASNHAAANHTPAAQPCPDQPYNITAAEIVLPERHEPGYAYPVFVWLHGDGQSEQDSMISLQHISDQNMIGIALRGNVSHGKGYRWEIDAETLATALEAMVLSLSVQYRIHSDRIFIGGFESGANCALNLLLHKPNEFAGAALLCPKLKSLELPHQMSRLAQGRDILMASQLSGSPAHLMELVEFDRLLEQLGLKVRSRYYQPAARKLTSRMLRDVDHWMISTMRTAIGV